MAFFLLVIPGLNGTDYMITKVLSILEWFVNLCISQEQRHCVILKIHSLLSSS